MFACLGAADLGEDFVFLFFFFSFEATPDSVQELFLALCLVITSGSAQGTVWEGVWILNPDWPCSMQMLFMLYSHILGPMDFFFLFKGCQQGHMRHNHALGVYCSVGSLWK